MARLRFQVWLDIRDMSPENLAQKVGVSHQAVDRWLNHGIPKARVDDVAQALQIAPAELYRFVDADISAELIDFAQDVGRKKSKRAERKEAEKKKAAKEAALLASKSTLQSNSNKTYGRVLPGSRRTIFDERRVTVDRRRNRWKGIEQECRRNNYERRDTSYSSKSNDWWLHVDYLDGQVKETPITPSGLNPLVKHSA